MLPSDVLRVSTIFLVRYSVFFHRVGGGYGYLSRSHGLAIDNIVEFDVSWRYTSSDVFVPMLFPDVGEMFHAKELFKPEGPTTKLCKCAHKGFLLLDSVTYGSWIPPTHELRFVLERISWRWHFGHSNFVEFGLLFHGLRIPLVAFMWCWGWI